MRIPRKLLLRYVRTKFKLLSAISKRKAAEEAFLLFTTPQNRTLKDLSPIFDKGEPLSFTFEGATTRGYKWNQQGKEKVLILHGYESSMTNFEHYIAPLVEKGYQVLAFDAPAHGRSTGNKINALIYRNWIMEAYRLYGPIKNFIAHSLGGLSLTLALEEISHDHSYKVALIAPATETTTAMENYFSLLNLDQGVRNEFEEVIIKTGGQKINWYSVSRAAMNIKAEVLFVQDRDDSITPFSDVEPIIHANYPNFHFLITEGLGHRRIYKDPGIARQVIDFF